MNITFSCLCIISYWFVLSYLTVFWCLFLLLVVGYTGAKKGSCFKFLRVPLYLMQYGLLSILTLFFYWNRPKNETVPSKKLNWMRGVCGGSYKWQFGPNILFYTILCWFWYCLVSFCGQRIHLWKFWENRTIGIRKNGRLNQNWRRRALCV